VGKKNIAYINNEMLIWARSETPFNTPEEVSQHSSNLDSSELELWENGEALPSVREAKELAKIYKVPFATFFLSEIPQKKIKEYTDRRTFLGTEYDELSYELWSEIRRINSDREIILEYATDTEREENRFTLFVESDDIKIIADSIRRYFNLPASFKNKSEYKNNSYNYFRHVIEDKGIIVAQISKVSLQEMKGLSIYKEVFPIIALNNKDYERAKTFSLFHEIAHIVRRSSSLCLIDDNERNDKEERLCDKIATEVLMPDEVFSRIAEDIFLTVGIWDEKSIQKLADRFGVSIVAAFRRLYDLGIISKSEYYDTYDALNESFNKNLAKIEANLKAKNAPYHFHVKYINAHGQTLPRTIINAYGDGRITIGETCKILNIKTKYLPDISASIMM